MSLKEYMTEKQPTSRLTVLFAALVGGFCVALLAFAIMLAAIL